MKRVPIVLSVLCLGLSGLSPARAAEPPSGPPKLLQIFREQVKPGKGAAHEKIEVGWPAAFTKANWQTMNYLAMTSLSGSSEAWFMTPWDSWAAMEKDFQAAEKNAVLDAELKRLSQADGELLSGWGGMLASYREDLSYRPTFDVAQMRYFSVITFRVNPGHEADFVASRKLVNEAHEKAKMDEHFAMYQVVSGAPGGTFLLFIPMKSLTELDVAREIHGKPYQDVLGEDNRARLAELTDKAVKSSESALFAFSPKMSYVSKDFAASDPDFWMPKAAPATSKKEAIAKQQ